MHRVITISRECGSGGSSIARLLAAQLRWKLVDDHLIDDIARAARIRPEDAARWDECVDSWFHRLTKQIWRGGYESAPAGDEGHVVDAEEMARLWQRAIVEAAQLASCVIVGRGGQCLLQKTRDVFHVSIYAPRRERIEHLRAQLPAGVNPETVVDETDRRRADYIRHHFNQDWHNRHLYHLMLCSSIGIEESARAILCAAGLAPPAGSRGGA